MASLTHVCIWSEKGWKRITAEEASRIHPGGTVSAHSGLFMCELCGQYVTFTHGTVQANHFRHSSSEKSKNCPERIRTSSISYTYNSKEHELPIKLKILSDNRFELMIGFIQVPSRLMTRSLKINIFDDYSKTPKVYLRERLENEGITYLPVGRKPCEQYKISISGGSEEIYNFWPQTVKGIAPEGTVFDGTTGKKLVYDSDVVVGNKYYLLTRGEQFFYFGSKSHISKRKICGMTVPWEQWCIYEIIAKDYDESAARFFLDYHCRLTDTPVSLQTVWPVFVEDPYIIKFNQSSVMTYLRGNASTTHAFPSASIFKYFCGQDKVLEIKSNARQQLISAGRTSALQYTYFWKMPLANTTESLDFTVEDLKGVALESGIFNELPYDKSVRAVLPFDGQVIKKVRKMVVEKRNVQANVPIVINDISWGMTVCVLIGIDCIWSAEFERVQKTVSTDESEMLKQLVALNGPVIRVPHTIGGIASVLEEYPLIRKWLLKCIRNGYMSEKAFRKLQKLAIDTTYQEKP